MQRLGMCVLVHSRSQEGWGPTECYLLMLGFSTFSYAWARLANQLTDTLRKRASSQKLKIIRKGIAGTSDLV